MNNPSAIEKVGITDRLIGFYGKWKGTFFSVKAFRLVVRLLFIIAMLSIPYWLFFASPRYVSTAVVVVQRTDQVNGANTTLPAAATLSGIVGPNGSDQLLLSEYLLSVDMLKKLDAAFDLRAHYSNWRKDPVSRMMYRNEPMEWFYRYWLSRVTVQYDNYNGVLSIQVAAYDSQTAKSIVDFMLREGEAHMNQLAHDLAQTQVDFLTRQVTQVHEQLENVTQELADFQNHRGAAAAAGKDSVAEFMRLQMQVSFVQNLYQTALTALGQGQQDAARQLKKVSVLQTPTLPDFPMEPARFYNMVVTLFVVFGLIGMLKLMESIILDHVD